jgi:RND family efflux transporter MFP subunit
MVIHMNQSIKKVKNLPKPQKIALCLAILFLFYWALHGCTPKQSFEIPLPEVVVKKPVKASMVDYVTQTGTLVAYNSVDLVARVQGYLDAIEFNDGTFVNKGKELFVIEPQPYMEKLKAAQASVEIAKAEVAYSHSEYTRQQKMYKQNATSLNSVESWLAKSQEAEGQLNKNKADEQNAAITYSYTHILAPFDGRIGRHLVSVGNLVGNGVATNLATIEQIDPLYVYFNLNELDLLRLRDAAREAGMKPSDFHTIPVHIALQDEGQFKYKATLDFINTGLNASTGTMELRAVLTNKEHTFLPGLFVQVRVAVSNPTPQLTVPDTAVLYDQIGPYVFIVDKNNKVLLKRVTLGPVENGVRGIKQGLEPQDQVIVEGLQNASPGNQVTIKKDTGAVPQ